MTKQNKKDILLSKLSDLEFAISEWIKWKNYANEYIQLKSNKLLTNNEQIEYQKAIKDYKKAQIGLEKAVIKYANILTKIANLRLRQAELELKELD